MLLKGTPPSSPIKSIVIPKFIFHILVPSSSFCLHSYFGRPFDLALIVSTELILNFLNFIYFTFSFINSLNKLSYSIHFKLMVILLPTCLKFGK